MANRKGESPMGKTVEILGVSFSKRNMDETVKLLVDEIEKKPNHTNPYHVITANPEIVMGALNDPQLKSITEKADLITPDGIGIVLASRWQEDPVEERVSGYDLLLRLLEEGDRRGWSFYFLGSSEDVNVQATDIIRKKYPNIKVVGRHNGFFKDKEEMLVNQISELKPDVLIVALGAPRQELWIDTNRERIQAKVVMGVGGSLDVIAGKVKRAPLIWQKLNLEWLYRLLSQPSRWRRQLVLPQFAVKAYFEAKRGR
jgi:N-acetylglucosaminyldiphosphoundecaprenol N-acetyl-beta-D-mannosaminyltransferase